MLVDTSVLIRTLQPHHSLYISTERALRLLPAQGRELHIVAQNLIELWTVATRPFGENGLGMTAAKAATELEAIKGMFLFLPETPAIYPAWEALVIEHQVIGKPAHDARLVAAMQAHGLTAILTFDRTGFSRYLRCGGRSSGASHGLETVHSTRNVAYLDAVSPVRF